MCLDYDDELEVKTGLLYENLRLGALPGKALPTSWDCLYARPRGDVTIEYWKELVKMVQLKNG